MNCRRSGSCRSKAAEEQDFRHEMTECRRGSGRFLAARVQINKKQKSSRNEGGYDMIGRVLPNNGMVGENVKFDRIRRITGYLVGTTDRFNDAKRAEERDRVKHGL